MKIIIICVLSLINFGGAGANVYQECDEVMKPLLKEYDELIILTKKRIVQSFLPPVMKMNRPLKYYGFVLYSLNINDKGKAQDIRVIKACRKRLYTLQGRNTIKKYIFKKAKIGETYTGVVLINEVAQ